MWLPDNPDQTPRIFFPCPGNDPYALEPGMIGMRDAASGRTEFWFRPPRVNQGDAEPDPVLLATSATLYSPWEYIDFDTSVSAPSYLAGRMFWDSDNDCPAYYDSVTGTLVQLVKEMLVDICNNTGSTILNGQVVCADGSTGSCLEVTLANAQTYDRNQVLAVATHDILDGATGKGTKFGRVNDFDTSGLVEGKKVYLSITDGELTSTRPAFPAKPIVVGYCISSNATTGTIFVDISPDTYDYEFDGCIVEKQDYEIVVDGGNIYADVEKLGGGDLPVQLNGDVYLLDCTTGSGVGGTARVQLTAGTDTAPTKNYIYVIISAGVATLQASTTKPSGVFANVGSVNVWSSTKTSSYGPLTNRRTTDAIEHSGRGHIAEINDRIRALGSQWEEGITPTVSIVTNAGVMDSINVSVAVGKAWQLHLLDFPALASASDGAFLCNSTGGVSKYTWSDDIADFIQLVDGTAIIANQRFNLVIFGVINKETDECKLLVGNPIDIYTTDEAAYRDTSRYSELSVDANIKEVVFPIVRIPLLYTTVNGGTLAFINPVGKPEYVDIRGVPLNSSATGGGGSIGASVLNELDDVSLTTPAEGDVLKYVSGQWVNDVPYTDRDSNNFVSKKSSGTVTIPSGSASGIVDIDIPLDATAGGTIFTGSSSPYEALPFSLIVGAGIIASDSSEGKAHFVSHHDGYIANTPLGDINWQDSVFTQAYAPYIDDVTCLRKDSSGIFLTIRIAYNTSTRSTDMYLKYWYELKGRVENTAIAL